MLHFSVFWTERLLKLEHSSNNSFQDNGALNSCDGQAVLFETTQIPSGRAGNSGDINNTAWGPSKHCLHGNIMGLPQSVQCFPPCAGRSWSCDTLVDPMGHVCRYINPISFQWHLKRMRMTQLILEDSRNGACAHRTCWIRARFQGWREKTGNRFPFYGLRQAHLILKGWARRITGGSAVPRIKKIPIRKYLISGQRNQSAVWKQGMSHV